MDPGKTGGLVVDTSRHHEGTEVRTRACWERIESGAVTGTDPSGPCPDWPWTFLVSV